MRRLAAATPRRNRGPSLSQAGLTRIRLAAVAAPAILAAWLVWRATSQGVAFTPDGISYLQAARSFASEARLWVPVDCGFSREWLKELGPFYPVLLGSGIKAGWEPFLWTRALNIICAMLATASAAWGTLRLSGSAVAAALAGFAIALLPSYAAGFRSMLSEPPYIALVMLGWLALTIGIADKSVRAVRWAAVAIGFAAATRYEALPLAVAAACFAGFSARRLRSLLEFLAISLIPAAAFAWARSHFSAGGLPRPFALHLPQARELGEAAKTIAGWWGLSRAPASVDAAILTAVVCLLIVLLIRRGKMRTGAGLALALAVTLFLSLLLARAFFDVTIDLGSPRLLIVLFPLGVVAFCGALPRRVLIPVLALLAGIHVRTVWHALPPVEVQYNSNHPDWLRSETLDRAAALDAGACVYSNAPDVIYRRFSRPTEWLPEPVEWLTGRPQPWCETAKKDLERHPRSVYIFFDAHNNADSPTVSESQLTACLPGLRRLRSADGTILLP